MTNFAGNLGKFVFLT